MTAISGTRCAATPMAFQSEPDEPGLKYAGTMMPSGALLAVASDKASRVLTSHLFMLHGKLRHRRKDVLSHNWMTRPRLTFEGQRRSLDFLLARSTNRVAHVLCSLIDLAAWPSTVAAGLL